MAATAPRLRWQLAEVVAVRAETPRTKSLLLAVPAWPGHQPGQHVDVRLTAEDGYQAQRSYSIASAPEDTHLALTVERLAEGEVSPYLTDELRAGDRLELRGPIGGYFTWTVEQGGPVLLVAGGSGIVPLMAMLRHRAAAGEGGQAVPARLLASWRSADDIIYRAELDELAAAAGGPAVIHTLTRSQPPGWAGYARRIDQAMLAAVGPAPAARPLIYVCGPTALVEAAATALAELGHPPERIKTERFGPSGA